MCAAEEAFFLGPPPHFREEWLPDPESTRLFRAFRRSAPAGTIPNGSTVQGLYCMTAEAGFLSAHFARTSREAALRVLEDAWGRWEVLARQRGYQPKPVPRGPLDPALGKPVASGGLKLEVAVRDLPRGEVARPGREEWQRAAYNLNWIDFTPAEARGFATAAAAPQPVPAPLFERLALKTLKDAARGQCRDWPAGSLKEGRLQTQCLGQEDGRWTVGLTGAARLEHPGRAFSCRLHGRALYDSGSRRFLSFELAAAGLRRGGDQFNFREDDPGPAPLGIAFTQYSPE